MSMVSHRREVLAGIGAAALLAGVPRRTRAADSITVLNWQGYGTDEDWAVKAFAERTGIEVIHDYFNAEAEMVTKLRTNPGAYDVVLINTARIAQVAAEGLIDPADFSAVPHASGLTPSLRDHANLTVDGKPMGVAWVWGMNALAVRQGKTKPDSFAALSDPAWAGRVAHFDDAVTAVMIGALLTGQDSANPADLAKVGDALKAMKPGVKLIWTSEDQWNKAFAANEFDLAVYWSGAAVRSQRTYKPAARLRGAQGRGDRLAGLPGDPGHEREEGAGAEVRRLDDRPRVLRRVGDQGRCAGLGQRDGDGPAAGGRPEPQDPRSRASEHHAPDGAPA